MEPPFSVINTMGGAWQARKQKWRSLGIKSEVSREGVKVINNGFEGAKYGRKKMPEVSMFDPALTELMYSWFCPTDGCILDPFAGGSVRGVVASYLGFKYTGIDIRQEQIDSNREQAVSICQVNNQPQWYVGDSNIALDGFNNRFDFIFSCPPYADLEVYSDLDGDISNKDYTQFISLYSSIVAKSCRLLKRGCYACFVVGDIRDKKGYYRDFISHTKKAFIDAGCMLYNEAILLQPLGTAMLRADRVFSIGKKLTKVHENILIFKKP